MEANNSKHDALIKQDLQNQLAAHPEYQGLSVESQTLLLKLQYKIDSAKRNSTLHEHLLMTANRTVEKAKEEAQWAMYQLERAENDLELMRLELISQLNRAL